MTLARKAFTGASWISLSRITSNGLQLLQILLLARLLSPQDFGLAALATIVIGFAQAYADMGMGNAVIHKQHANHEQLSSLYWLDVIVGLVIFCVIQLMAPILAKALDAPSLTTVIRWFSVVFLIEPFGRQFRLQLEKQLSFGKIALLEIAASVISTMVAVYTALLDYGVFALVWGHVTMVTIKTGLLVTLGWKASSPSLRLRLGDIRGFAGFGFFQMAERSVNFLGFNLDKLALGSLLGVQALGYYNVAYQLMSRPYLAFNPILTRVAFPVLATMQQDEDRMRRNFLRMISIVGLVMFPIYALMFALAEPLVHVLLGNGWGPAANTFQILTLLGFFYSLGNPLGSLLLAKGRTDLGFYLNLLMICLYLPAVWLGSNYGAEGVAWSLVAVTAFGLFPIGFVIRYRLIGLRPFEYLQNVFPFFASALTMAGTVSLAETWLQQHLPPGLRVTALALGGGLMYCGFVYKWKKHEWKALWAATR